MTKNLTTLLQNSGHLIFFSAQTQYNNLGDLIINYILLNQLKQFGTLVVKDRDVPDWYYEQLGLSNEERASQYKWKINYLIFFAALRLLLSCDRRKVYLIETPGHRYGKPTFQRLKILLLTLFHSLIFRFVGVRICTFGVSIGPFSKSLEILEWWRSKILYFYSVRDSLSVEYARKIGIKKVARFPDLAWLLDESVDDSKSSHWSESEYVIFSFREKSHNLIESKQYQQNLYQILDKIAELVCKQWSKQLVISYGSMSPLR